MGLAPPGGLLLAMHGSIIGLSLLFTTCLESIWGVAFRARGILFGCPFALRY